MKLIKSSLLLFSVLLAVTGCNQEPYPSIGDGEFVGTPRQEPKPPDPVPQPLPALAISLEDNYEFREGRFRKVQVRVAVEEPGEAIVKVEGLPDGATFDEETLSIDWTPGFFMGNNPSDPSIKSRIYPVTVWLRSTALPKEQLRKTINFIVFDSPRNIGITTDRNNSVSEGKKYSEEIKIDNPDYPQGPFKVLYKDLPPNMDLEEVDANTFRLKFEPDFFHVKLTNQTNGRLEYTGKLIVSNPAGHQVEKEYKVTVRDERQSVEIVDPPKNYEQGLDASFQVTAYDLNREVAPKIKLTSNKPDFGDFSVDLVENPNSFSSTLNVFWKDIPPRYNNTVQTVEYEACVLSSAGSYGNCKKSSTKIKIVLKDRSPPSINRADWPSGELIYLGFNETLRKRVIVTDTEDRRLTPDVKIFPVEMRKYVTWNANRDSLTMKFDKAGVHQFNLVAISDYNMMASESFIVEVFPEKRKRTLLFADSTRDPEVIFYKERFKDSMDVMNPAIQEVNLRNVSDRDTLVITTSTLMDPSVKVEVNNAINTIKNVVIATSLYENLPEEFKEEMGSKYGLVVLGRYSRIPEQGPLDGKFLFTDPKYFDQPTEKIRLKKTTTSESFDPVIFDTGLDDSGKICKGVVGLSSNGTLNLKLGVSCSRIGGGKITFLGTEWADLMTTEEDKLIPVKWFNTLLNNNF